MCSNPAQRIAAIGQAIDDLAAEALAAYAPAARRPVEPTSAGPQQAGPQQAGSLQAGPEQGGSRPTRPRNISDADQVVIRLAALWAQLADLDPEVARRLPTYEALSSRERPAPRVSHSAGLSAA